MAKCSVEVQNIVRGMLQSGLVEEVLAFVSGLHESDIVPQFIADVKDIERIVTLSYYPCSLAKLVAEYGEMGKKIGMVARSCDVRAAVELAKRQQINLDNLYVIGIECYGVVTTGDSKGKVYVFPEEMEIDGKRKPLDRDAIAPHCLRCEYPIATMADVNCRIESDEGCSVTANTDKGKTILAAAKISVQEGPQSDVSKVKERALNQQAAEFNELKNMNPKERLNYWLAQFDKCIKCYGCRNACPICYCKDCYLGPDKALVQRGGLPPERIFHIGRLLHIGDSCVDCGQCETTCPMGIPVSKLYHMLYKELSPIFDYEAGFDLESLPPVSTISTKDLTNTGVCFD